MKAGDELDGWRLQDLIGRGGNATVWRAARTDGTNAALKILNSARSASEPYARFRREIETLEALGRMPGILPILGSSLPDQPSLTRPAWIALPIATPIDEALEGAPLDLVVTAMERIAQTLAGLHDEHGIAHRDVKPRNLYQFDASWVIGDLGLVAIPDAATLTGNDRPLGPTNFMPYEMLMDPANADGKPADVYSFAKTLWVLATNQRWAPPGEQRADDSAFAIGRFYAHPASRLLDELVARCTRVAPADRPPMGQVAADLRAWLARTDKSEPVDAIWPHGCVRQPLDGLTRRRGTPIWRSSRARTPTLSLGCSGQSRRV